MKKYILFDHDGVLVDTEFWFLVDSPPFVVSLSNHMNGPPVVVCERSEAIWWRGEFT